MRIGHRSAVVQPLLSRVSWRAEWLKGAGRGGLDQRPDRADVVAGPVLWRDYGEVDRLGERSTSRVISLGAKTRNGGPQKPVPRLV
jgi:hypothetical protein